MSARIDEMPAGRALDARVAEKVRGWPVEGVPLEGVPLVMVNGEICDATPFSDGSYQIVAAPHYSTDISAAWDVVEKVAREQGQDAHFTIVCRAGYSNQVEPKGEWMVGYQFPEADYSGRWRWSGVFGWGEGVTAPLAICRAALKAVGYAP